MNPRYAATIGATTLPPTLRAAVERLLDGSEPEGLRLRNQPRSRSISLVTGERGLARLEVQEPFLWWGLSGSFNPVDPNDLVSNVSFTIEVTDGCYYYGDSSEGASMQMLCDLASPLYLMPPVLIATKQPVLIRTRLAAALADDVIATFDFHGFTIPVNGL